MAWLFPILLLVILIGALAMLQSEGLWGNILNLVNVVLAALIATNFWEPVADLVEKQFPDGTYFADFVSLWLLFIAAVAILRQISTYASRVRVRFRKPVEITGNYLLALVTGWIVLCFATMTIHTAPLAREPFGGGFKSGEKVFYGLAPDRAWLNVMISMSNGGLSDGRPFDPNVEFIAKYDARRAAVERAASFRPGGQ